jgi:S-adenosylmethionine/arginine decarboxylase-like enzyme
MNEQAKTVKDLKAYRTVRSIQSLKLKKDRKINRVHVILDLYKCDEKLLAKAPLLEQKVKKVLNQFSLEPKIETFYQFQPFGVTAIVCAQGLQFTMHTWPEYQSAALDLYSFGDRKTIMQICDQLKVGFKSDEYEMKVRKR